MEEVELIRLPDKEQVSDDFNLFMHDGLFYAIRTRISPDHLSFCIEGSNKQTVIATAVNTIHEFIINHREPPIIPHELALFYIPTQGNA